MKEEVKIGKRMHEKEEEHTQLKEGRKEGRNRYTCFKVFSLE
jgi:hypothetical protein